VASPAGAPPAWQPASTIAQSRTSAGRRRPAARLPVDCVAGLLPGRWAPTRGSPRAAA
jgi:hypothetical protein